MQNATNQNGIDAHKVVKYLFNLLREYLPKNYNIDKNNIEYLYTSYFNVIVPKHKVEEIKRFFRECGVKVDQPLRQCYMDYRSLQLDFNDIESILKFMKIADPD